MLRMGGKRTLRSETAGSMVRPVKHRLIMVVGAAALASCVHFDDSAPALVVTAQREGEGCRITVEGERVANDRLLAIAKQATNRLGIVVYDKDTPYRCLGGSIFTLQRAGLKRVEAALWSGS
jgi:hypothetical protein